MEEIHDKMPMDEYLESFNPPQRETVEFCDGPSLVIAGAGSGKTRVLTYKIAHLINQHDLEPWSILALTFTNKAAGEMKERIAKIVGENMARTIWMGTFHSIFLRILRIEHEHISFSQNFTIYDTADSKSLVKAIVKEMELDEKTYKPSSVLDTISRCKNQLVTAEEYASNPANVQSDARRNMPALAQIFQRYSNRCRQSDAMDFDDILLYTFLLFDKCPDVRERWASRFKYILVDEYQDTNFSQHQIVWQLSKDHQKVCVVGDDAQSIYSFRGANIDNILSFQDRYKGCKLFKLEQNYRSTQNIVQAANSLIEKNRKQIQKKVFSENDKGEKLHVIDTHSDIEESNVVINSIKRIKKAEGCEYRDFAILYRTNAQSRVFEDSLRKEALPYRIYGGLSFYQRKEIKDIIAYFRLTVNPNDEEAFRRIINYPARGIGQTTVNKIATQANLNGTSLWNVICFPEQYGLSISKSTLGKIVQFQEMMNKFSEEASTKSALDLAKDILHNSGILNDIYKDATPEDLSRQENVEELVNGIQEFCESRTEEGNEHIYLIDYLSEVSLMSDVDSDNGDDDNKITLMTIHSAKGLEFDTVFVVGLEEGLFPSQMVSGNPREMEEERRLFYVAITRAKTHCFITYAQSRFRYGQMEFSSPSRFITDIDPQFIDRKQTLYSSLNTRNDDVSLPWAKKKTSSFTSPRPFTPFQPEPLRRPASSMPISSSNGLSSSSPSSYGRPVSSAPTASQSAPSNPSGNGISAGSTVLHDRFGRGTVLKVEGQGDNTKARIRFDNSGEKILLLKFAKLRLIN